MSLVACVVILLHVLRVCAGKQLPLGICQWVFKHQNACACQCALVVYAAVKGTVALPSIRLLVSNLNLAFNYPTALKDSTTATLLSKSRGSSSNKKEG